MEEAGERPLVRQRTERNGGAGGSSHNAASPAASGRSDGVGLRDELASIGESIKTLQTQSSKLSPGATPPPAVLHSLWALQWRLRPFLFLASPASVAQWKLGGAVFAQHHRRHYARDAAHVAIALRLYLVLLRLTVVCPAAALHGCLTLLSVFAVVGDPRLRAWKDSSERVVDGLLFVLRALRTSETTAFAQFTNIVAQLLSEVTTHFDEVPPEDADLPPTALYLDLSVNPSAALRKQTAELLTVVTQSRSSFRSGSDSLDDASDFTAQLYHDVFSAHVCVETAYESRCVQSEVLRLIVALQEQKVVFDMPRDHVSLVCNAACHLVSSAVPGMEAALVNHVQHETAWHALQYLLESPGLVLPHAQGPLLLTILLAQWHHPQYSAPPHVAGVAAPSSMYGMTVSQRALLDWCLHLDDSDLLSLVTALEHASETSGSSGAMGGSLGQRDTVTLTLVRMWETAIQWCLELYSAPSADAVGQAGATPPSVIVAMTTLCDWVGLCERVFACMVHHRFSEKEQENQTIAEVGDTYTNALPGNSDEYAHQLQLLANELPLLSITASLLCTQVPPLTYGGAAAQEAIAFIPHRILAFFAVPVMPAYVLDVVERAKNCVDVSAYRLLEANALAVVRTLSEEQPSVAVVRNGNSLRGDAASFEAALSETAQVLRQHASPAHPYLVQALIVLLHFYPESPGCAHSREEEPENEEQHNAAVKSGVVARLLHDVDAAVAAHTSSSCSLSSGDAVTLPEVPAAMWNIFAREAAVALFKGGSGLGWSRRMLVMPETSLAGGGSHSSSAAAAFLYRAAGIAQALEGVLRGSLIAGAKECDELGTAGVCGLEKAFLENRAASDASLVRVRCTYDGVTNLLAVALPLFTVLETLLRHLERTHKTALAKEESSHGKEGTREGTEDWQSAAATLLSAMSALQVQLLEAKYTFACIAGAAPAFSTAPPQKYVEATKASSASRRRSTGRAKKPKQSSPQKQVNTVAVVVDVDDDDDDDDSGMEDSLEKDAEPSAAEEQNNHPTSAKGGGEGQESGNAEKPVLSPATSKTHQLERLLELHRDRVLPAVLAAVRPRVLGKDKQNAAVFTSHTRDDEKSTSKSNCTTAATEAATPLLNALLQCAFTSAALTPPANPGEVRELFSLDLSMHFKLSAVGTNDCYPWCCLLPAAAREVLLWSRGDGDTASTRVDTLFLLWLTGADKLVHTLTAASKSESASSATAAVMVEAVPRVLEILWLTRRCFQKSTSAFVTSSAGTTATTPSERVRLCEEACLVHCEHTVQEGRGWLMRCFDLYGLYRDVRGESNDAALAIMGLCVETARDVMTLFAWSATDLLRFRERSFVFSSFLKAVVDKEDRDMKVVLSSALDVLGRYLVSAETGAGLSAAPAASTGASAIPPASLHFSPGTDVTRLHLKRLMERENIPGWHTAAGALAYVLYECSGRPVPKQVQYLSEVMGWADKSVRDIPSMVRSTIHVIAFHLVSLEADAQLAAQDRQRRSGRGVKGVRGRTDACAALGPEAFRLFDTDVVDGGGSGGDVVSVTAEEGARLGRHQRDGDPWVSSHAAKNSNDGIEEEEWEAESVRSENVLDSIAFSVFERALEQLVTLCESADTAAAVEASLTKPVGRIVAAEELRKSMFAVLDSIYKAIRIEPAAKYGDDGLIDEEAGGMPGSVRTRRRWLLGCASFIRFMGPQTTPIALMLPTLLERCSRLPSLVPFVCIVWRELVCACTEEYLTESAASIALSLVSLEQHAAPQTESRALLMSALQQLYKRTQTAQFWDAYKVVLSTFSKLAAAVLRARRLNEEPQAACKDADGTKVKGNEGAYSESSGNGSVNVLLSGFVTVMRSGSLQSTTVFVRALYQYLSAADLPRRLRLSQAAARKPEVVETLLRCSAADAESALYAMRCISILGAVTTATNGPPSLSFDDHAGSLPNSPSIVDRSGRWTSAVASSSPLSPPGAAGTGLDGWSRMTGAQSSYLDAETVLNWRKFSFTLLREYFPHVFASTADPVLHNCIAFAVQELIRASTKQERLQHKGVELRREDVVHVDELERYLWWARLTPHVKQLLGGFTTTRYSLSVNWQTRLRAPEYRADLSYRHWLFAFFNHLVISCSGWLAEMVQPLRNVAKKNSSLILYLLPYLVVHLLELGKAEDVQYLECEMRAVLEAVVTGSGQAPAATATSPSLTLRSQSLYESHPDATPQHEPREHAHTVLSILEDVEQLRWSLLRNRGRIHCVFDQQEQAESLCIRLAEMYGEFLRCVPWTVRCRAALKIGSHIRALRSVECQRRIPALSSVIQTVPLQRIFAALNDRESARSIHRATPGLSLEDTAFSFENNGDWLSALGSSELVLQHRPSSGQHQLTALHCMNELGELYLTSRYASSLLMQPANTATASSLVSGQAAKLRVSSTTFSQIEANSGMCGGGGVGDATFREEDAAGLRGHVQAYANEAAWRLGQWDTILPAPQGASVAAEVSPFRVTGTTSVSLALSAAYLHRELTGRCALPRVQDVTDAERRKIVPMVRAPSQEGHTVQGHIFTLLLHALGDVDAVSEMLCANIAVLQQPSSAKGCSVRSDGLAGGSSGDLNSRSHRSGSSLSATPRRISAALLPSTIKNNIAAFFVQREAYVEDSIDAREPLLSLHRLVYRELGMPQQVAETWLKQSELLRDAGLGEAALTAARQAAYESPDHIRQTSYYVLVANLLHDTQSATPAMEFARECVADERIPVVTRAHLQMLLTNWLVETGSERPERVFAEYDRARELDRRSELVHYQMAVFYDHLHTLATNASENAAAQLTAASPASTSNNNSSSSGASAAAVYTAVLMQQKETVESIRKHASRAIHHFGEALLRGTEKASVSLPRMLTLWLDSAAFLGGLMSTTAGKLDGSASAVLEEMNSKIRLFALGTLATTIPPGVVMTALPQLLSRLGHPVMSVRQVLTDVVLHLLSYFPQQCLWLVLPMALSKEGPKEVVEAQILKPFAGSPRNERVLRHAKIICDTLLTICNCSASLFPKERGLTQLSQVQKINPMLPEAHFILPVLSNFTPNVNADEVAGVFPTAPCFDHFDDRVMVMRSLQKPKRIWIGTSEGREMSFLCKSKDEPRKDIRMMEVATLMNSFFLSDPEAKRKRFSLRRYSVTALSDDCAVIEWLNDTATLAKVAMECYSLDRTGVHISSVKKWVALVDDKKLSKMDLFKKYILPEAPPVMHQWLDRTFSSNQSWYAARNLFTQSTALWSIAGHIVGLGDRHAENLMLDLERGELMHVDFACMFDKGEKLEVPEQVRFRLTQNLTDVMGVLGAYGPFQATCEVALRCEMKNKSAVMSIVETLLHEPLVEWRRQSSRSNASNGPKQLMERVARRLDGFLDLYSAPPQKDTLALNVQSQVAKLIHHSSDLNNLSQMYIWWMAWI